MPEFDDDAAPAPTTPAEPPPAQPPAALDDARPRRKRGRPRRVAAARRTDKPVLTPRLSIFINDAGEIVFDRTRPETIDQLRAAIARPEAQKRLGLVDDSGQPAAPRTWAGMTTTLVDAVNSIAIQAAVNHWKLTDEQAQILFLRNAPAMPDGMPSLHAQTVTLTGNILDKRFPGGFGEYDDEISLVLILGSFVTNAVQQIAAMKTTGPREVVNFRDAAGAGAGES